MHTDTVNTPDPPPSPLRLHELSVGTTQHGFRLKHISCEFHAGKVTTLIGPNGAGKSTLLSVASAQLTPQTGHTLFCEKNITHWTPQQRAQKIAVLPQHHELNFAFTVDEIIQIGRLSHNETAQQTQRTVQRYAAFFDLTTFREREYTTLSGGEKQRVHLARTFAQISALDAISTNNTKANTARLLLLDEPTNALDLAHQALLMDAIRQAAHCSVTVICAIHDLNIASQISDHILCLEKGQIRAQGTPEMVLTQQKLEAVFATSLKIITTSDNIPVVTLNTPAKR